MSGRSARRSPEYSKRLAVLVASGMIVGESLFGVIIARPDRRRSGNAAPLALVPADFAWINWIAIGVFVAADRCALRLDHGARAGAHTGDAA